MTNPPVPATPLDVEACVRLLEEAKSLLADRARNRRRAAGEAEHSAEGFQWLALANQDDELIAVAGALAAALPGMGKDSEPTVKWWGPACLHGPFTPDGTGGNDGIVRDRDGRLVADCGGYEARADVIAALLNRAARAAQPEETSADD